MCDNYAVNFNVHLDGDGILHVSPKDNVEGMALKHVEYLAAKHGLEKVVIIHTDVPIKLGAE